MNINPALNALAKIKFRCGSLIEYNSIIEKFMSVEGALEVRFPNDDIKTYHLPVDSKIKEFVQNQENFKKDIKTKFVHPNVYIHETLFQFSEDVDIKDAVYKYCSSLKHNAISPKNSRALAFQNKVSDKVMKDMFPISQESEDVHYTKDTFDGILRKNLAVPFRSPSPEEILKKDTCDFMDYLQPALPTKLYGLYTQEDNLNCNLKYVIRYSWQKGSNDRRVINQEEGEKGGIYVRDISPLSYHAIDYKKGLIFAHKFYRQFNYVSELRHNFSKTTDGRIIPMLNTKTSPLNMGLSIVNFPQMNSDGATVETNEQTIYDSLLKVNSFYLHSKDRNGSSKVESEYSLMNYEQAADLYLPYELKDAINNTITYRWASFYLAVNRYRESHGFTE